MASSITILVVVLVTFAEVFNLCNSANILMVTMGGTKSHKIPYWELARGLIPRGHNITFLSAFPADFLRPGLEEITPSGLVFYVKNFTNWDLVGARMRGEEPVQPYDVLRYSYEACEAMLSDSETKDLIHDPRQPFDLIIMDGAYPECSLGLSHHFRIPFMYINTVAFYTGTLSLAGNPIPFSVTPFMALQYTDRMNVFQRAVNTVWHWGVGTVHSLVIRYKIQAVLRDHFGRDVPQIYDMSRNVSFILQNGHASVTYPRPYLPNVAEIACIHCKPAKPLPMDLEEFIASSGDAGFIYVSMGSSVKAANMPEYLRRMLLYVFRQLPQRVLWKYELEDSMSMHDLPENVKLGSWLPQQDILGHPKLKAFVTHGGLLSMFETVYHGVPIITMPVFCDHDANAAKAEQDGYAIKLELSELTADSLLRAIKLLIHDPHYRRAVKRRQMLLRDQKETPLERAVYWTEYVLRHKGALHLQSPSKDMGVIEYYLVDVLALLMACCYLGYLAMRLACRLLFWSVSTTGGGSLRLVRKSMKMD